MTVSSYFWVLIGGALGCLSRFQLSTWTQNIWNHRHELTSGAVVFPVGTLLVNLFGAIMAGFLFEVWTQRLQVPIWRYLIFVGFLGGFTTFSAFGLEVVQLLRSGAMRSAVTYILMTNGLGIPLVMTGMWLGRLVK